MISSLHQYFKSCVVESYCQYALRQRISRVNQKGPRDIREDIINQTVKLLAKYRQQCSPTSAPSQLVIPDGLKLLPIYTLSAMKTHAFRLLANSQRLDEKVAEIQKWLGVPFGKVPYMFYPRVYRVTNVTELPGRQRSYGDQNSSVDWGYFTDETEQSIVKPKVQACEIKKISSSEAYVLDDGDYINLLIGSKVPPEFCAEVLGHETFSDYALSIASGASPFQPVETEASQILFNLLE